jgi:hypothetical protein
MSSFIIMFAVLWIGSLVIDYGRWKRGELKDLSKRLYVLLNAATLILLVAYTAHIRVPMPTEPFTQVIANWVKSSVRGHFHA